LPFIAIAGLIFVGPKAFGVLTNAATGKGAIATPAAAGGTAPAIAAPASVPSSPAAPGTPAPLALAQSAPPAAPAGCIAMAGRCACFDAQGGKMPAEPEFCDDKTGKNAPPRVTFTDTPLPKRLSPDQLDAYRFAFLKR
jgi:hypothetical protein